MVGFLYENIDQKIGKNCCHFFAFATPSKHRQRVISEVPIIYVNIIRYFCGRIFNKMFYLNRGTNIVKIKLSNV